MKLKEILSNTPDNHIATEKRTEDDVHHINTLETPLRADAFEKSDQEKIDLIARHFREIMHTLGLDLTDDSLRGTPERVA